MTNTNTNGQIAIYQTGDGRTQIDVKVEKETLWLTLLQMAALFDRDKSVISRHLKNIFDTGELPRGATVAKTATVQTDVAMVKKAICKKCILQRLISI